MGVGAVTEFPEHLPQKCIGCGAGQADGRRYIDTGMSEDFYGVIYICGHCIREVVDKFGEFVPLAAYSELEAKMLHYRTLSQTLTQKVGALNDLNNSIESLRFINNQLIDLSSINLDEISEAHRIPLTDPSGTDESQGQSISGSDESTPSGRSTNIFGT